MAPRRSSVAVSAMTTRGDGDLRTQRERPTFVDRREPGRQLTAAGHRQHRAGDAGDEIEKNAECRDAGTDSNDRGEPARIGTRRRRVRVVRRSPRSRRPARSRGASRRRWRRRRARRPGPAGSPSESSLPGRVTSSPSVAMRAYPANAKNRKPADRRTPADVSVDRRDALQRGRRGRPAGHHDRRERGERRRRAGTW